MPTARRIITKKKVIFGKSLRLSGYSDDHYYASLVQKDGIRDEDVLLALKAVIDTVGGSGAILDVGANIGYISMIIAQFAPQALLHAFEPVPSNAQVLKKNIADNRVENIHPHVLGLGREKQSTQVVWSPENRGGAFVANEDHEAYSESEPVKLDRLDDIYKRLGITGANLIKLDIEGYELDFLAGATEFIAQFKPVLVVEANAWCLDGLRGISLPVFLDEVQKLFPFIHGFWGKATIDVTNHREIFMHENLVHNRYMNMICSHDPNTHQKIVNAYQRAAQHLDYQNDDPVVRLRRDNERLVRQNQQLERQIAELTRQNKTTEQLGIKASSKALVKAVNRRINS